MRITAEKATLAVTVIGDAIAGAAYINDLISERTPNARVKQAVQITTGPDSPAISNVNGNVIVTHTQDGVRRR
jgi:hypothetical protein